jgi:hypothetical protein
MCYNTSLAGKLQKRGRASLEGPEQAAVRGIFNPYLAF